MKHSQLAESTAETLQAYLDNLGETEARNVYRTLLADFERPMLEVMMRYAQGNQSKAAQCLGLNRATLRNKLKRYNLA